MVGIVKREGKSDISRNWEIGKKWMKSGRGNEDD